MSGKRYPEEFKIEAVNQVIERGYSVGDVADQLEVTRHSLYAWINRYDPDKETYRVDSDKDVNPPFIRGIKSRG